MELGCAERPPRCREKQLLSEPASRHDERPTRADHHVIDVALSSRQLQIVQNRVRLRQLLQTLTGGALVLRNRVKPRRLRLEPSGDGATLVGMMRGTPSGYSTFDHGCTLFVLDTDPAARTASPHRRPENSAPWMDGVSRWSPHTNRPSPSDTACLGWNGGCESG